MQVFKALAAKGNTKAANESVRGFTPWNKGKTKGDDAKVASSAKKRVKTLGGSRGLADIARGHMARHKRGPYTGPEEGLPKRQREVLQMARKATGEIVSYEHFMLLEGGKPIFIDVAVPKLRLAIEVDGTSHGTLAAQKADAERDDSLKSMGWRVLRIKNDCVDQYPDAVSRSIEKAVRS